MGAAGIRNPRVVAVRNLAKSEHRNFASIAPSVNDSRAVRSSVLVSDSDSVSELSDSAKRRQEPELITRRLSEGSRILQIQLLDHVIVGYAEPGTSASKRPASCRKNLPAAQGALFKIYTVQESNLQPSD